MLRTFPILFLAISILLFGVDNSSAQLVINEFDYDQPGTDSSEFIEIKNISVSSIDLSTYNLILINGVSGSATIYNAFVLPAVNLFGGDYFVICANPGNTPNCDLFVSPSTNLIQNGATDAIAITDSNGIVDVVSYEGDVIAPYVEGSGVGLQDFASIDHLGLSRFPDGSDTDMNNVDFSRRCISPGETNLATDTLCTLTTSVLPVKKKDPKILLFPNPSSDAVYIYSEDIENAEIFITDIHGRMVSQKQNMGILNTRIDVSGMASGTYIIQIRDRSSVISKRLVVTH